ncbi:Pre-mRNA-splicing factor dre4 like protein [Verticillium longisporum]|nr:Pre-mRNA-splicing factor dre4 like protein [Verticillium longisporum]
MLQSTYQPSPNVANPPPLLPGWTEHTAPTGHKYYYNTETKQSTYTRPSAPVSPAPPAHPLGPSPYHQHQAIPNLSDPNVANAYLAQLNAAQGPVSGHHNRGGGFARGGRGGGDSRSRPQPNDRPRTKAAIPGFEPWILVTTKYGRRFAYNPDKNTSYWRIPEKLKPGILELEQARILAKTAPETDGKPKEGPVSAPGASNRPGAPNPTAATDEPEDNDSSEYEEVEVTDDEAQDEDDVGDNGEHRPKRQRTEQEGEEEAVEFSEADIAFQLQAMGEAYGLDPGEYDDGNADDWPDGADGVHFSEEDARALFKDLLDDYSINPYNTWDKLIEEGRLVDDPRYTVLDTMKARKETWQEWSKDKIQELKEQRAKQEKTDPRIPYMALLQDKANPKLYWQEFKRKYRKEAAMTDPHVKDKDREKWYREHINRLKMPQATLKADLAAALKALPVSVLNNKSSIARLPSQLLVDIRYISLPPAVRDPLIKTFIQTAEPAPEGGEVTEEDEATKKARDAKQRREAALRNHEERVAEQKRQQQRSLEMGKARLREEEREIERAMQVGKQGLHAQLATMQKKTVEDEPEPQE